MPILAGPSPLPLDGRTSAVTLSGAVPLDRHPESPATQLQIAGTVSVAERWEAGPLFLLDIDPTGDPGPFSAGFFLRLWAPGEDVLAAIRLDAGWGWVGLGADLAIPASDLVFVTSNPGFFLTPDGLGARFPLGVVLRRESLDFGGEFGAITTLDWDRRVRGAGYLGLRVAVRF